MRAAFTRGLALTAVLLPACAIDDRELTVDDPRIPLLSNAQGFVDGSNRAGILGYWTYFVDTPGCTVAGYSLEQCSTLFDSTGGLVSIGGGLVHPDDLATGRICMSGVAAQARVNPTTMEPDFAAIWGAGIQLTFNDAANEVATSQTYDAPAHKITGFSFETDSPPAVERVEFPGVGVPGAAVAYWGGKTGLYSVVRRGLNVIDLADVAPQFASGYPPFDPRTILAIRFHVNAIADQATPFDYCIWNLSARTE